MVLGGVVWLRPSPVVHEHQISRLLAWSSRAVSFCISLRALWPGCLKTAPGPGTCDRLQGSCEVPVECMSLGGAAALLRSSRLPPGRVLFIVSLPRFLPTRPRSHFSLSLSLSLLLLLASLVLSKPEPTSIANGRCNFGRPLGLQLVFAVELQGTSPVNTV